MAELRRVDPCSPGITRRGRGRGFEYLHEDGERVTDSEVLERISELVIPPAWRDVWICAYPMGHIQAIGTDAAGRRRGVAGHRRRYGEGMAATRKRAITRAVKEVSSYLGNTPAVARASYIDPRLWDRFEEGLTIDGVLVEMGDDGDVSEASLMGVEQAVLELLEEREESEAVERVA